MHSVEVTQSVEQRAEGETGRREPCLCEAYARVTEGAALAAARWLGSGDEDSAEGEAVAAMRSALELMPILGRVVIGASDDPERIGVGEELGRGGDAFDLAVHPLEGRGVVARGGKGAMSMIAVGEPDSPTTLPQMYMRRMAIGPVARGRIDLLRPVGENIRAIADAFGRRTNDITTIVLDRPRHHDLVEEIRAAGARIKLIQDGDVTASISAEIERAREQGIDDVNRVFTLDDLAPGETIVAATGVSNGDLLRGVQYLADSARTRSLVMCTRCNWVRFVDGIHFFARERREEVRLPGL